MLALVLQFINGKKIETEMERYWKYLIGVLFVFLSVNKPLNSLADSNWIGQWISTERSQSKANEWLIYRKTFMMEEIPAYLVAKIAADTKYWLWINDQLVVFEGGLKRGPDIESTYYDEVEIAPYLKKGENMIALLVWHFGKSGFSHVNSGRAGLLFDCQSPQLMLGSDATWNCAVYDAYQDTEAPFPNYRLPESNIRFDARKKIKDWNRTSFSGNLPGAISILQAGEAPLGKLVKRPIPLWKNSGLLSYEKIRKSENGDTLYCRLPYNCQVTPYLKVESESGNLIKIQTDNYAGGGELNVRAEYITCSDIQEYESYGWMNGHEIWYIIPKGVTVLDVKYRETGYDTNFEGSFTCNDPFYNELWKRSARTLYITMRDNYMDCPDRERAQWWGDEVNELGEAFYALSLSGQQLAVKGIYELMNWQRGDGTIFSPIPSVNWGKELPMQMLASVGWYGFYTQYFYSADSSFVPIIYDRLHRYLHEVWKVDSKGIPKERAGGWTWGDWGEEIDMGLLTTCWYYLALKAEREFAIQLGKQSDVSDINRMMERIEKEFDDRYWTGSCYRSPKYKGKTDDRSQAMAILSGLTSSDKYKILLEVFKKEYHASPYMEKYVLEALFQMKSPDLALQRMKNRYAKMLSYKECTTLFEGWGPGVDGFGGGTINHAWSGGPLTLLSQKVCGIDATSPGFRTFKVEPQLGALTEVSATVPTSFGKIDVSIVKKHSKLEIKIVVPQNTKAEVIFPNGKTSWLESGIHELAGN